jgi:hypothetical protein
MEAKRLILKLGSQRYWLITPFGFYSVVAKSGDLHDGLLTIRRDLEALNRV